MTTMTTKKTAAQSAAQRQILAWLDGEQELTPEFVFKAGNLMNAAYTILLSKIIRIKLVREWKRTEFYDDSVELGKMLDIEKGWPPESDLNMVNMWAKRLTLSDWFSWHPFEDVPLSYYKM